MGKNSWQDICVLIKADIKFREVFIVVNKKALEGIRVLDFTQFLAGPYCCMLLADMGAEVIKIERPGIGDATRSVFPKKNEVSMYFSNVNRGKKSITVDLKTEEGKAIFKELIKTADVLVENNRPGVMERLGFGYARAKELNKGLVYASISGFGQYGPYRERPGYDIIAQAMGGAMSITGWPDGPATRSGIALGDILAAMNTAFGILSAIIHREKTGEGQNIDVALVDSIVASLETISMVYICDGKTPRRTGNRYLAAYPYDSFEAKDTDYVMACGTDRHFQWLAEVMGMPELAKEEKFLTIEDRKSNGDELKEIINKWGKDKTAKEIVDILLEAKIPAAPIYDIKQVYEDPHINQAREMFVEVEHPIAGQITITGSAIKMSETPSKVRGRAPMLGEHNEEIYRKIGLDGETLEKYKEKKII